MNNMSLRCGSTTLERTTSIAWAARQSSTATETGRVFRYDPVADVITPVATHWPPGDASTLPGGFTVFKNKIYILGGFDVLNGVRDRPDLGVYA